MKVIKNISSIFFLMIILFTIVGCEQTPELTINFNSNGGSLISSITFDGSSIITLPNDPTKEGYTFEGWYLDDVSFENALTNHTFLDSPITSDIIVYAKWAIIEVIPISYEVRFITNGGTYVSPIQAIDNTLISYPQSSRTGYTLEGWYTSNDNGATLDLKWNFYADRVGTDMTLYAKWTINSYTISFNSNLGSSVSQIYQEYHTNVTQPSDPTREGYTFVGWYKDIEYTQLFVFDLMPAENMMLYAKWEPNLYEVTYHMTYEGYLYQIQMSEDEYIIKTELGSNFGVILTNQGRVMTWGENSSGVLGIGTTSDRYVTDITSRFPLNESDYMIDISIGYSHVLALSNEGRIFSWGSNSYGALGDGTTISSKIPIEITSQFSLNIDTKITYIEASLAFNAALTSDHHLWVWGRNESGQLGINSTVSQSSPIDITNNIQLNNEEYISSVSLGWYHFGLVTSESRVWMWGSNSSGQLGNGNKTNALSPIETTSYFSLSENDHITNLYLGNGVSSAISLNHEVFTWGSTFNFMLGLSYEEYGMAYSILIPYNVTDHLPFEDQEVATSISMGYGHTLILSNQGHLYGMGANTWGELGSPVNSVTYLPKDISKIFDLDDINIVMYQAYFYSSVMVSDQGLIYILGYYYDHQGTGYDYVRAMTTTTPIIFNKLTVTSTLSVYYDTNIDLTSMIEDETIFIGWFLNDTYTTQNPYLIMPNQNIDLYTYYPKI